MGRAVWSERMKSGVPGTVRLIARLSSEREVGHA